MEFRRIWTWPWTWLQSLAEAVRGHRSRRQRSFTPSGSGEEAPIGPTPAKQPAAPGTGTAATPPGEESEASDSMRPPTPAETESATASEESPSHADVEERSVPTSAEEDEKKEGADTNLPVPVTAAQPEAPVPEGEPSSGEETRHSKAEGRSPEQLEPDEQPAPQDLGDAVARAAPVRKRLGDDEGLRREGEPWRFGARRILRGDSRDAAPSRGALRPELWCRRTRGRWEIVLRADVEVSEVREDATVLEAQGIDGNEYSPRSFRAELRVEMRDGQSESVPLFRDSAPKPEPLIFRVSRQNDEYHGRRCRTLGRGLYVVIAPKSWTRDEGQFREPEPCHDDLFSAHFFSPDPALKDGGSLGGWSPQAGRSACLAGGTTLFDSSDDGVLYVGNAPDLEDTTHVDWVRVGEERDKGWKGQGFRVAEDSLPSVLAEAPCRGRFFLRTYRPGETVEADSTSFRWWPDLAEIRVNGRPFERSMVLPPGSDGHPSVAIHLLDSTGETVFPQVLSNGLKLGPDGEVIVEPQFDADSVRLGLEGANSRMNVEIAVPRIWWRLPQSERWVAEPLILTRQAFRAGEILEVIVPESVESVRVDTGHEFERSFLSRRWKQPRRRMISIPLADFRDDDAMRNGGNTESSLQVRVAGHDLTVAVIKPTAPRRTHVPVRPTPPVAVTDIRQRPNGVLPRHRPSRGKRSRVNPRLTGVKRVDWKDVDLLREFLGDRGKIQPRRVTRASARLQRQIRTAIKRARQMALLPYE